MGFAFELITPTRVEKARILGTALGKKSLDLVPLELEDSVETDNAAWSGGMNSDSSTLPFQGSIEIVLVSGSFPLKLQVRTAQTSDYDIILAHTTAEL